MNMQTRPAPPESLRSSCPSTLSEPRRPSEISVGRDSYDHSRFCTSICTCGRRAIHPASASSVAVGTGRDAGLPAPSLASTAPMLGQPAPPSAAPLGQARWHPDLEGRDLRCDDSTAGSGPGFPAAPIGTRHHPPARIAVPPVEGSGLGSSCPGRPRAGTIPSDHRRDASPGRNRGAIVAERWDDHLVWSGFCFARPLPL